MKQFKISEDLISNVHLGTGVTNLIHKRVNYLESLGHFYLTTHSLAVRITDAIIPVHVLPPFLFPKRQKTVFMLEEKSLNLNSSKSDNLQ